MIVLESVIFAEPPIALAPGEIKALVRHRDGYRCVDCGMPAAEHLLRFGRNLDVHRLIPGGDYSISNCQTLCRNSHKAKPKSERGTAKRDWVQAMLNMLRQKHKAHYRALKMCAEQDRRSIRTTFIIAIEEALTQRGFWPPTA